MTYKKQELLTLSEQMSSPPVLLMGSVLLIFWVCCVVLLCFFPFFLPCWDVHYDIRIKRGSVRLYLQWFVWGLVSYLRCLVLGIVVSNTYCGVFLFCCSSSVCPMLPVSLDYPFLIVPSVFTNVYCKRLYFTIRSKKFGNKGNNKITEQSYKGKVKTHNYTNGQNQSTTGKLKTVMTLTW